MRISLQTAKLAIGQMQFNKLPKREQLIRRINPMARRDSDTEYIKELLSDGLKETKPIFNKLG